VTKVFDAEINYFKIIFPQSATFDITDLFVFIKYGLEKNGYLCKLMGEDDGIALKQSVIFKDDLKE